MTASKKEFQWRDAEGSLHNLKDMDTHHIFFSWLMVWNHICPEDMQEWWRNKPNPRTFGPFYTDEYMESAIAEFTHELQQRTDMSERQKGIWAKVIKNCVALSKAGSTAEETPNAL
jgi:hypothetical protein